MKTTAFAVLLALASYEEEVAKLEDKGKISTTGPERVAVGDGYTRLIGKYPKKRQEILDAASLWYGRAWPDLDDVWKLQLRGRLRQIYASPAKQKGSLPAGWGGPLGEGKAETSPLLVHSGSSAARLSPSKNGSGSMLRSPSVELPKGKPVKIEAWVLSDETDGEATLVAHFFDPAGKLLASRPFAVKADLPVWTRWTDEAEVEGAVKLSFDLVVNAKKGTVVVDDVSVKVEGKELLPSGGFEPR